MRTTEVFVEQLIIGALVVGVAGALFFPVELGMVLGSDNAKVFLPLGFGAYLVGIAFDRFADTILEQIEKHHRLTFALAEREKRSSLARREQHLRHILRSDPFPEDRYRVALLSSDEATEYGHYMRTRMRLTRAIMILGPALGAAAAVTLATAPLPGVKYVVGGTYALCFLACIVKGRDLKTGEDNKPWRPWDELPRTDEEEKLDRYGKRIGWDPEDKIPGSGWLLLLTTGTFGGFFLVVITVVNTVLLYRTDQGEIAWPLWSLPWAGLLVTLTFGWVWWRVLETFFTFLRDHYRFAPSRE